MAEHGTDAERGRADATLRQTLVLEGRPAPALLAPLHHRPDLYRKCRRVFDAEGGEVLPGKLVLDERLRNVPEDLHVREAFNGCGVMYDFLARVYLRNSLDGQGGCIDATVHYGRQFANAMWNGQQLVFGDGDGLRLGRFTASIEVIAHELAHALIHYTAGLAYDGQSGALHEHLADAFGIMARQHAMNLTVEECEWLIGADLLGPAVRGRAIRSLKAPGTAYDDPILGRDPQPSHMRDYIEVPEDHGGVHVNSGIPNHAFYLACMALGGHSWTGVGRIWYVVLTRRLRRRANFAAFAAATVSVAGELFGKGSDVQQAIADSWSAVGIPVPKVIALPPPAPQSVLRGPARFSGRFGNRPFTDIKERKEAT